MKESILISKLIESPDEAYDILDQSLQEEDWFQEEYKNSAMVGYQTAIIKILIEKLKEYEAK